MLYIICYNLNLTQKLFWLIIKILSEESARYGTRDNCTDIYNKWFWCKSPILWRESWSIVRKVQEKPAYLRDITSSKTCLWLLLQSVSPRMDNIHTPYCNIFSMCFYIWYYRISDSEEIIYSKTNGNHWLNYYKSIVYISNIVNIQLSNNFYNFISEIIIFTLTTKR